MDAPKYSPRAVVVQLSSDAPEAMLFSNPMIRVTRGDMEMDRVPSGAVRIMCKLPNGVSFGTGTFIGHGMVATAGHVIQNALKNVDRDGVSCARITVIGGPRGAPHNLERLQGEMLIVHKEYYSSRDTAHDLAVIFLGQNFRLVRSLAYKQTPTSAGQVAATVLGYPAKQKKKVPGKHKKALVRGGNCRTAHGHANLLFEGDELFHSRSMIHFDPNGGTKLVEHESDTLEGHSGGPVIDDRDDMVIAIHRGYGSTRYDGSEFNQAVAIGHHGNDLDIFVQILSWCAAGSRRYSQLRRHKSDSFSVRDARGRDMIVSPIHKSGALLPVVQWQPSSIPRGLYMQQY